MVFLVFFCSANTMKMWIGTTKTTLSWRTSWTIKGESEDCIPKVRLYLSSCYKSNSY